MYTDSAQSCDASSRAGHAGDSSECSYREGCVTQLQTGAACSRTAGQPCRRAGGDLAPVSCCWLAHLQQLHCVLCHASLAGKAQPDGVPGNGLGQLRDCNSTRRAQRVSWLPRALARGCSAPARHAPVCTSSPRLMRLHVTCAAPRFNWPREPAAAALGVVSTAAAAAGTLRAPAGSGRRSRVSCCLRHWCSLYCCCSMVFAWAAARCNHSKDMHAARETAGPGASQGDILRQVKLN